MIPELELLLACARLRLEPADRERVQAAVARGIDGNRLFHLAAVHGLLPLLHLHIGRGDVPAPAVIRVEWDATEHAARNLELTRELVTLLRLCGDAGIPLIPLKGPVLAQQIYGRVSLRRISDLDVLLREPDIARVMPILEARGYQMAPHEPTVDDEVERRNSHHVSVVNAEKMLRIELHHCLLRPRARGRWDFDTIAPRLVPLPFMGRTVPMFTPEDLLVYLCEHGAEHTWIRLEWLVAVAELVQSGQVQDWARVTQWAGDLGTTHRVRAALLLANALLGVDISAASIAGARSDDAANRIVTQRLFADPFRTLETPAERFRYMSLTDPSLAARLRRAWTTALTPSAADTALWPLPKALRPLYGVVRPLRLAVRRLRRGL